MGHGFDRNLHLQRSVFRWVSAEDEVRATSAGLTVVEKLHAQITAAEVARDYGVPAEHLIKHLTSEIDEATSCCFSLPFTLLLVVSYAMVSYGHDSVVPVYAVEDSITHDIEENANFAFSSEFIGHKTLYDVNTYPDFWSWMIHGFVPLIFVQGTTWAEGRNLTTPMMLDYWEPYKREDRGFLLQYNRIVGGVRLRQEISEKSGCDTFSSLLHFYDRSCVGGLKYEIFPEMWLARRTPNPTREWWMWANDDSSKFFEQLQQKELEGWLDERTMKIEISIPVYNGQFGVHTIVFVNFYFSRGGRIWKRIIPMSTYSRWFHGLWNFIPDSCWLAGLLFIIISEVTQIVQVWRASGWRGLGRDYFSVWNVTDWAAVCCGLWIIAGLSFRWLNTRKINKTLEELGDLSEVKERAMYHAQAQKYILQLEDEVMQAHVFRILLGMYPMLIVVRLFKAFSAQPRLSLVTRTLGSAAVDLLHFMLVFASIFITYAVAGIVLFGREVDGFANLTRASNTCFRCMMGDFDWEELQKVGRVEAGLWFVSFMVIIVLILLNMLLAIVMDAYSDQKEAIGDADTLMTELEQARHRWKGQVEGRLVSLKDACSSIQKHLDKDTFKVVPGRKADGTKPIPKLGHSETFNQAMDEIEEFCLVTVGSLQQACPRMREEQAIELIEDAVMDFYKDHKEHTNAEEMLRIIRKVNYSTKKLKRYMKLSLASNYDETIDPEANQTQEPDADNLAEDDQEEGGDQGDEIVRTATSTKGFGSHKGKSFAEELAVCRNDLKKAKNMIGEEEPDEKPALAQGGLDPAAVSAAAIETYRNTVKKRMMQLEHHPLERIDDVAEFSVKKVLDDENMVLNACRNVGIGTQNDTQRIQALGLPVRVVEKDKTDNTVKCRVPGVGDIWFALGALTNVRPEAGAELPLSMEEREAEEERQQLQLIKPSSGDLSNHEEVLKRIKDVENEIRTGRQVVSEALHVVSELEWRVVKEQEEKMKIAAKFQLLKKKVVQLTRENRKLKQEELRQQEKLELAGASGDEYHEIIKTMLNERRQLKNRLPASGEPDLALADIPHNAGDLSAHYADIMNHHGKHGAHAHGGGHRSLRNGGNASDRGSNHGSNRS